MSKPSTPAFWDDQWTRTLATRAEGPDSPTWANDIDRRKLAFLEPRLPHKGTAVEVGCGAARLLCRVGAGRDLRLVAVDLSPAALDLAKKSAGVFGVELETRVGDALALPFPDASVDVVLSGGLLEHFPEPEPVLREMVRILAPGGLFYADVVPRKVSWYRWHEARRMARSHWMAENVYESSFGPGDYVSWLEGLGCTNIVTASCGVYPSRLAAWPGVLRRPASRILGALDGTVLADALGWYFMIAATRP